MHVFFSLLGSDFEWDEEKARANEDKHGVTFPEATEAFFDPFVVFGDATVDDELCDLIIGYTLHQRLLLVVFVERGQRTRLISARPASRSERQAYENA